MTFARLPLTWTTIAVLAGVSAAQLQPQPPAQPAPIAAAAVPDLCRGAVDPYDPVDQRTRFFKAAGVDNEMNQAEFDADAKTPGGFAQKFDVWAQMLTSDKNKNGTIDWFEADEYRQSLRKRVMAAFDADHSGTLTGAERTAANAALASGKVPAAPAPAPQTQPDLSKKINEMDFDKDGDGKLSVEERKEYMDALRKRDWALMTARYDKDGDGKLNDEERKAMFKDQQGTLPGILEAFANRNFDLNGDGKLDDDEKADVEAFKKDIGDTMKGWEATFFDTDGDGKVSDEERKAGQKKFMLVGVRIGQTIRKFQDADGDGVVTPDENRAFAERLGNNIGAKMKALEAKADADGDGRLSEEEREVFIQEFDKDFRDRVKRFDADGDGKISPKEAGKLADDWIQELAGAPKSSSQDESAQK